MKRLVIPAAVLLTALILTGGFFLPTFVSQIKDRQTIGELTVTDGSGVSYETKSELKTIDRLKMITSAGMIGVDNGKNMDADKAFQTALTELEKLAGKGLLEINREACSMVKYDVVFFIDSADPSKNMITWQLFIQDETYDVGVAVDDETGMLLALDYHLNERAYKNGIGITTRPAVTQRPASEPVAEYSAVGIADMDLIGQPFADMDLIGQTLADYYGLTLISTEPQESSYYTRYAFELSDGQDSVVLFVTLTYTGFFVNS